MYAGAGGPAVSFVETRPSGEPGGNCGVCGDAERGSVSGWAGLRLRLPKKKKRAAMIPRAAMAPMTIPAMAPPEMEEEDGDGDGVGVVDAAAEVADWDSAAVVVTAVEVGVVDVDEVVVLFEVVDGKMMLTDSAGMGKTSKAGRSRLAS